MTLLSNSTTNNSSVDLRNESMLKLSSFSEELGQRMMRHSENAYLIFIQYIADLDQEPDSVIIAIIWIYLYLDVNEIYQCHIK